MAAKAPKKAGGRKKAGGYKMPGHIPKGEVLTDTGKLSWAVNVSIGVGGFGEIYSASKLGEPTKTNYVIKIEPLENGPLFCERNVYVRIGKREDIAEFMQLRKLNHLGMPQFYGFGSHEMSGTKYRFLVMERYGRDLWSLFLENGKVFPPKTVFSIGIQVMNVLEYMHSKGYVHADIKGANLLLGQGKAQHHVFLVDLGLACKYSATFKPDPKKAHNGTLEYTSRDAHQGVTTRRGDVEILGYNMLHWTSSTLPWGKLKDPPAVHDAKKRYMENPDHLIQTCFKHSQPPGALLKYMRQCLIGPLEEPNYNKLRQTMEEGVRQYGRADDKLEFTKTASPTRKSQTSAVKKVQETEQKVAAPKTRTRNLKRRSKSAEPSKAEPPAVKRSWRDFPTVVNGAKPHAADDLPKRKKK